MEIIAIRLLDARLAWQSHNESLCPANHNTSHLALSIDNIHTDGAVCCTGDETHIWKHNHIWTTSGFVCCLFTQECVFVMKRVLTPQCARMCVIHWVLTLNRKQEILRKRVLVFCERSCEVVWNLAEKKQINTNQEIYQEIYTYLVLKNSIIFILSVHMSQMCYEPRIQMQYKQAQ